MRQSAWIVSIIVALFAELARAAEPPRTPEATSSAASAKKATAANVDAVVPQRQVTFAVSQEETPATFQAEVPTLLDQRFVVQFALKFNFSDWTGNMPSNPFWSQGQPTMFLSRNQSTIAPPEDRKLEDMLRTSPRRSLQLALSHSGGGSASFSEWIGRARPERLPPADVLADLKRLVEGHQPPFWGKYRGVEGLHMTILAPTSERAEILARAMLTLVDYGFLYPVYQDFREASAYLDGRLRDAREKTEQFNRELSATEKELADLKEFAGFTQESMTNLASQEQMIAVDEAGVKARIDACNKILEKRKDLNPNRVEQVETVKIAAEIELVGLAAKRKALEDLLKKVKRYVILSTHLQNRQRFDRPVKNYVAALEQKRTTLQATLEPKTFFGQVVGVEKGKEVPGTVFIHKIKWVEPESMGAPGPARR